MSVQSHSHYTIPAQFSIKHTAFMRPFSWLIKGGRDLAKYPKVSLAHGLNIASVFWLALLVTSMHVYALAAVISGFMLVGPIMAAGLCEISRRLEDNQPVSFDQSLTGLSRNQSALFRFAGFLVGFSLLWFVISGLVLMVAVGEVAPPLDRTMWGDFFAFASPLQTALYMIVGGLLAAIVFTLSVVAVPAIIDSRIKALDAAFISVRVVVNNILTMVLWAVLLALFTGIGIATFMIGMIVIFPLLGHATWHAYRDLVSNSG